MMSVKQNLLNNLHASKMIAAKINSPNEDKGLKTLWILIL